MRISDRSGLFTLIYNIFILDMPSNYGITPK